MDVPQGQELKYITYRNQMAKMMVESIIFHSKNHKFPYRAKQNIRFKMKINRNGALLELKLLQSSLDPILDHLILESVKNVGLFNSFPKFIEKDTLEIFWEYLT